MRKVIVAPQVRFLTRQLPHGVNLCELKRMKVFHIFHIPACYGQSSNDAITHNKIRHIVATFTCVDFLKLSYMEYIGGQFDGGVLVAFV